MKRISLLIFLFVFCTHASSAEILTFERGGATNSVGVVDNGELTLEGGLINYADDSSGSSFSLGAALLRYGLFDKFELRTRYNGVLITDSLVGFDNLTLGFKYALLEREHGIFPIINLTTNFQIPIGREELRNPGFNHSYELVFQHGIVGKFSSQVTLVPSFNSRENRDGEFSTFDLPYVFNLNYAVSDEMNLFSNIFGVWGFSSFSASPLSQDIGLTYAFTEDFAMDLSLNWGLNESAPDFGLNCGFAVRLLD